MNKNITFLTTVFIFLYCLATGQHFAFRNYTVKDGLPSATIYAITQDDNENIWMATEFGLSRFDGLVFKNFGKEEGLPASGTFKVAAQGNKIWFASFLSSGYLLNDTVHMPRQINENITKKQTIEFSVDSSKILWATQGRSLIHQFKEKRGRSLKLPEISSFLLGAHTSKNCYYLYNEGLLKFENHDFEKKLQNHSAFKEKHTTTPSISIFNNEVYLAIGKSIYSYDDKNDDLIELFENLKDHITSNIRCILADDQKFWVLTQTENLLYKKNSNGEYKVYKFLPEKLLNIMFKDKRGSYWFGSNTSGLYYLPSTDFVIYNSEETLENDAISAITKTTDGKIVVGYFTGVAELFDTSMNKLGRIEFERKKKIQKIKLDKEGKIWICSDEGLFLLNSSFSSSQLILDNTSKNIDFDNRNRGMILGHNFFKMIPYPHQPVNRDPHQVFTKSYAVKYYKNWWLGTINGLYKIIEPEEKVETLKMLDHDITCIEEKDGLLWVGTNGDGLFILKDSVIKQISTKDGLSSDYLKELYISDSGVWIATNKGINKINANDFGIEAIYRDTDGVASDEISGLTGYNGFIYASSTKGISVFDEHLPGNNYPPKLTIRNLKINEKDTLLQDNYSLDYFENNIKILYTGIHFKKAKDIEYAYKLNGLNSNWIYTSNDQAAFTSLRGNNYIFYVKARVEGSEWSEVKSISFRIRTVYWQTIWFWMLLFLVFILLMVIIFKRLLTQQKQRELLQQKAKSFHLAALKARINPHFVFNALGEVQTLIHTDKKAKAIGYLDKFSELMGRIIEMSENQMILLEDELQTLRMYLELESLRFDKFEYDIVIDEKIDPLFIEIPSTLIQPYVENAIRYGLSHKLEGYKFIKVTIKSSEEGYLSCVIEDNGVGRERGAKLKPITDTFRSSETKLLSERLELLNSKQEEKKVKVITEDLKDEEGKALGTKVVLELPYMASQMSKFKF